MEDRTKALEEDRTKALEFEGKIQRVDWTNEEERPHKGLLNMLPKWMRRWAAPGEYNYDRESARRRRQIERGILNKENRGI